MASNQERGQKIIKAKMKEVDIKMGRNNYGLSIPIDTVARSLCFSLDFQNHSRPRISTSRKVYFLLLYILYHKIQTVFTEASFLVPSCEVTTWR